MKDRRILVETDSDKAKKANKDEDGLDDNPNAGERHLKRNPFRWS